MDMQAFQAHNGLTSFINRLEMEVNSCRKDQPFEIVPSNSFSTSHGNSNTGVSEADLTDDTVEIPMETDASGSQTVCLNLFVF